MTTNGCSAGEAREPRLQWRRMKSPWQLTRTAAARLLPLVLLLSAAMIASGCQREERERITIRGETLLMELAVSHDQRTRGMMFRDSFPEDGGMLFVFPDVDYRYFWMKNCIIDMDVIFLDPRGVVTAAHRMTVEEPRRAHESERAYEDRLRTYPSRLPAQFAIELPAGSIDRLRVQVDDRVEMDLKRLKAMAR
jgi:uncharacterized protein